MKPALFVDRDGVINHDGGYTHRVEDFSMLPGVAELLGMFQARGYLLVVVTNQAGVARGYYDEAQVATFNDHVARKLGEAGVMIDAFYHCPHHPQGAVPAYARACECRKPRPGMLLAAARDLDIELAASWMIGDKHSDVQAGLAAGLAAERCLLVTGNVGLASLQSELSRTLSDAIGRE